MSGQVLFEVRHRGNVWRMEIADYQGRTFFNCRKWFPKEGELRPSKEGFTMPLERLHDLREALKTYLGEDDPDGRP